MCGCGTNEVKKGEIGKMFLRRFDVCALSETKLKVKGEVVGRVSGVAGGRAREGVALLLSGRLMRCVVEWKEVSSRLIPGRYLAQIVAVKLAAQATKRMADQRWGGRLGNDFEGNKKMYWKEVKRVRKGELAREEIVKDVMVKCCAMA